MPPLTPLTARDLSLVAWAKSNAEDLPGGKVKCKHCDGTYTFRTKKNGQNDWPQYASFATHLKDYHVNTTKLEEPSSKSRAAKLATPAPPWRTILPDKRCPEIHSLKPKSIGRPSSGWWTLGYPMRLFWIRDSNKFK